MNKFLRLKDVRKITNLSRSSIYRFVQDGTFPRPVKLGQRSSAWVESEINQWADDRLALRDRIIANTRTQQEV